MVKPGIPRFAGGDLRISHLRLVAAIGACLGLAACSDIPDRITVGAMGGAEVFLFVDRDGDGKWVEGFDRPAGPFPISLLNGWGAEAGSGTTGATGVWRSSAIPVGAYEARIAAAALGDTLVLSVNPMINVQANDTSTTFIGLGYPIVTPAQLESLPVGRYVAVHGIALQASPIFSDRLFHLRSGTTPVRAVTHPDAVPVPVGDSVVVVGRIGTIFGRRAVIEATTTSLLPLPVPGVATVTASIAATANGGTADGALVRVTSVRVDSVTTPEAGGRVVTVSDASGKLTVAIDPLVAIAATTEIVPGAQLDVTGVLVPADSTATRWTLRPRANADVSRLVAVPPGNP